MHEKQKAKSVAGIFLMIQACQSKILKTWRWWKFFSFKRLELLA